MKRKIRASLEECIRRIENAEPILAPKKSESDQVNYARLVLMIAALQQKRYFRNVS